MGAGEDAGTASPQRLSGSTGGQMKATPLPVGKLVVLCLLMLSGSVAISVVFPFVGFMVRDFGIAETDNDLGYYAGYIASAFSVGNVCSSYIWGMAADKHGRRPILLLGLVSSAVTSLAFGFSSSFYMAVGLRFLQGLGNGNIAVAKSYISEVTDSTNQARAFSLIGLQWGTGLVIGSSIGGFFAEPARKYPGVFSSTGLFAQYPYLLPMLIISCICCIAVALGYHFLTETLPPRRGKKRDGVRFTRLADSDEEDIVYHGTGGAVDDANTVSTSLGGGGDDSAAIDDNTDDMEIELVPMHRRSAILQHDAKLSEETVDEASEVPDDDMSYLLVPAESGAVEPQRRIRLAPEDQATFRLSMLWRRPVLIGLVIVYFLIAFQFIIFDETFALLALMPPRQGGLAFTTDDTGFAMLMSGATTVVLQLFVFTPVVRRIGHRASFRIGGTFTVIYFFAFPWVHKLRALPDSLFWPLLSFCMMGRSCASVFQFTNVFIMVSNVVPVMHRGKFNGLAQSLSSLARAMGPAVGGTILAWSMNHGGTWPLNHSLVYCVIGACALTVLAIVCSFPRYVEYQYHHPDGFGVVNAQAAAGMELMPSGAAASGTGFRHSDAGSPRGFASVSGIADDLSDDDESDAERGGGRAS